MSRNTPRSKSHSLPRYVSGFLYASAFIALMYVIFIAFGRYAIRAEKVEKPFPEFELPKLGESSILLTEKDMLGRIHVVNMWGSWCGMCAAEHDFLMQLSDSGVPLIGISYKDAPNNALSWLRKKGNPYQWNIVDLDGYFQNVLQVKGVPITYLVDDLGYIRLRYVGILNSHVWNKQFLPLITELRSAYKH